MTRPRWRLTLRCCGNYADINHRRYRMLDQTYREYPWLERVSRAPAVWKIDRYTPVDIRIVPTRAHRVSPRRSTLHVTRVSRQLFGRLLVI